VIDGHAVHWGPVGGSDLKRGLVERRVLVAEWQRVVRVGRIAADIDHNRQLAICVVQHVLRGAHVVVRVCGVRARVCVCVRVSMRVCACVCVCV
jgi:hypothetical protein